MPSLRSTILVADDSADTVAMLADVLESAGFTAMVALRGDRALSIARQVTPDLILLDAVMPGMDGFETCRQLKREGDLARVPVIFMTGLSEPDDIVRGLGVGGVDYITKPINPGELLARIRVHLANARVEQGVRAALDTTGRFLLAATEDGRLAWWTPQAGLLLAPVMAEPLATGARLPDPAPRLIAETEEPAGIIVSYAATAAGGSSRLIEGIARLGQGEILLRIRESREGDDLVDRLRTRLAISQREAEVLCWLAQGKANRDIADILDLSPRTVNKHLERIFRKIGVENRTAAAAIVLGLDKG